jgi:hypothetical protein
MDALGPPRQFVFYIRGGVPEQVLDAFVPPHRLLLQVEVPDDVVGREVEQPVPFIALMERPAANLLQDGDGRDVRALPISRS